jgi:ferredoxin-NADP reductase
METPVYVETKLAFTGRVHEYGDVYTYSFLPEEPISYLPGQYAHVRLSGMPEGVRAVREFSFVSTPSEEQIRFGVDAKSGSEYQKRLMELQPGDTVGLFKIKGHMSWPPEDTKGVVLIAGGIGVTPFRSMLKDKKEKRLPFPVTLIHVDRGNFLYGEELARWADEYITANRDSFKSAVIDAATHAHDAHFYVAGSPGFVESTLEILQSRNVRRIETDPFKGLTDEI